MFCAEFEKVSAGNLGMAIRKFPKTIRKEGLVTAVRDVNRGAQEVSRKAGAGAKNIAINIGSKLKGMVR